MYNTINFDRIHLEVTNKTYLTVKLYLLDLNNLNSANHIASYGKVLYELIYGTRYTNLGETMTMIAKEREVSPECLEILSKMLNEQITLKEILDHPWIKRELTLEAFNERLRMGSIDESRAQLMLSYL